jgi:hypothetical protein
LKTGSGAKVGEFNVLAWGFSLLQGNGRDTEDPVVESHKSSLSGSSSKTGAPMSFNGADSGSGDSSGKSSNTGVPWSLAGGSGDSSGKSSNTGVPWSLAGDIDKSGSWNYSSLSTQWKDEFITRRE